MTDNGHIEPCRDLKALQKRVGDIERCINDLKKKYVPKWVFLVFVGGLVTVSVTFITWHVSAINTITFEAAKQNEKLYEKIDDLKKELNSLTVKQEVSLSELKRVVNALETIRRKENTR